jgi:hypothetical protein
MSENDRGLPAPPAPGAGTSGRELRVIAGAIIAAAAILSITLVALHAGEETRSSVVDPLAAGSALGDSQDRAAQADLRNALVAAKIMYTDSSTYVGADSTASGLPTMEPGLCYVDEGTASVAIDVPCPTVSVYAWDGGWAAARMSNSGTCFWVKDDLSVGTSYGSGLPCTGTAAVQAAAYAWS